MTEDADALDPTSEVNGLTDMVSECGGTNPLHENLFMETQRPRSSCGRGGPPVVPPQLHNRSDRRGGQMIALGPHNGGKPASSGIPYSHSGVSSQGVGTTFTAMVAL
ncbi:MAG: hypothetical protein Fur005_14040 [Roseiflexaceae bacterium]